MNIKDKIKEIILETLNKMNVNKGIDDIVVESPKNDSHGDFSSNIAMKLTKDLNKNPIEIAGMIKNNIIDNDIIDKIEIANPGFVNFFIKKENLIYIINEVLEKKQNYGKSNIGNNEKVNVEFVSVNPTGKLHVGHARGGAFGDSLSNIMKFAGYDVTKEYYINDAGVQINNLGESVMHHYKILCGIESVFPEDGYPGEELKDLAKKLKDEYKEKLLNREDSLDIFKQKALDMELDIIKNDLKLFGIHFDVWSSEKSFHESDKVKKAVEILKEKDEVYKEDGALWVKTTKYGDEKDRVIIKRDGEHSYFASDIAYHKDKIDRGFTTLIDILGADHHGYLNRIKAVLNSFGKKDILEFPLIQMVRFLKDGKFLKMSKREGTLVTITDLIDKVGVDAARYFMVMRSNNTHLDFDLDLAVSNSSNNPVYYAQYAHARICSILEDIGEISLPNEFKNTMSKYTYDVLENLGEFKNAVEMSATKRLPHIITNYIQKLAKSFHQYYANEKILIDNKEELKDKIAFIKAVQIVLRNSLDLIGVSAPTKM